MKVSLTIRKKRYQSRFLEYFVLRFYAILLFVFSGLSSQGQSFIYNRPESDVMDTCVFRALQKARLITNTYATQDVLYIDTVSNVNTERSIIYFYEDKDSIHISLKRDFEYVDYLHILFKKDTLVCKCPLSEMQFIYSGNELRRIADQTIYTVFNISSFLEYLDFDNISLMDLGILRRKSKIVFSNEYGREGYEQYSFGKSIRLKDLKLLKPYIGEFSKGDYNIIRIDLENGFFDQLKCIYYLSKGDELVYKIRIWRHGAVSILHFEY